MERGVYAAHVAALVGTVTYVAPDESGSYKSSCSGELCPAVVLKEGTIMRDQIRRVLIAEDDSYDMKPLRRAFKKRPAWEIAVVYDGAEALDYLFKHGKYTDAWRSGLFILSLQTPCICGYEVLEEIKDIPQLASIPVVVWTASGREEDMIQAYARGAAEMKQCAIAIQGSWDQVWLPRSDLKRGEALLGLSRAGGLCCGVLH